MQFVHQALAWGFLLALAPLLIHLINLVRQRRIRWAAMEFLLQSYRRQRTWIWLQQLLLLGARMAALALAVAMLAQWVSRQQWLALFGGSVTHHYVLLDDSYSMSERIGAATAFDRGKQAAGHIASQAMARETPQKFTLIRFSRARAGATQIQQIADLHAEAVGADFDLRLEERKRAMEVTQTAVGPRGALEVLNALLRQGGGESNLVYLISDFREPTWGNPVELRRLLQETERHSRAIHLVRCATSQQPNLAISDLWLGDEVRAAGVPLFVHATVTNFGTEPARRVPLSVRTTCFDPQSAAAAEPGKLEGRVDEPPAVLLEEIPPGSRVTQRVQVYFPHPGVHQVEAFLPDDVVAADNRRWAVVPLADAEPALIIDGSPEQRHAYYLRAAFQPGGRAQSGVRPEVRTPAFLRDATLADLLPYRSIFLLDLDRLDGRAVDSLESYLRAGGGLAMFLGSQVNAAFYNQNLYRGGEGFFPLPLERDQALPRETWDEGPDWEVENHPLFSVFLGDRNPFLRLVGVERYFQPPGDWAPGPGSAVAILARLRNRQPLVAERPFGAGRVVVFLTTAAPQWNNWAQDPSFVVVLLRLHSYLASFGRREPPRLVGTPLDVQLDLRKYRRQVSFVTPGGEGSRRAVVERTAETRSPNTHVAVASLGRGGTDAAASGETCRSGIYEAWAAPLEGPPEVQRFALNVDAEEGNLALVSTESLLQRLQPLKVTVRDADDYSRDAVEEAGYNRSLVAMGLLIVLLVGEQLLAYSASYHPPQVPARLASGKG